MARSAASLNCFCYAKPSNSSRVTTNHATCESVITTSSGEHANLLMCMTLTNCSLRNLLGCNRNLWSLLSCRRNLCLLSSQRGSDVLLHPLIEAISYSIINSRTGYFTTRIRLRIFTFFSPFNQTTYNLKTIFTFLISSPISWTSWWARH